MKDRISKELSAKITHLSALMTLFVVFIHYSAMNGDLYSDDQNALWLALVDFFGQGITRNAVPLFFLISGILAFWNVEAKNGQSVLIQGAKKRIRTLGIPYLLWNCIATVFSLVLEFCSTKSMPSISFAYILRCLFNHQHNFSLWYVQKLLTYSWLAPVLYYAIRKRIGLYTVLAVSLLQHVFLYDFLPGFVFYVLGAGLALHAKKRINHPHKNSVAVCALVVFVIIQVWRITAFDASVPIDVARGTIEYRMIELLGPIALWFAVDMVAFAKIPVLCVERETFAVYVTRVMTLSLVTSTVMNRILKLPTTSLLYAIFMFFLTPLVIYLVTVLLAGVMKKIMPKAYSIAMGGR